VADVGHVGVELDDVLQRAPGCLDERLDGGEHLPRLALEVAAVGNAPILFIRDLTGQEQDRLGAGHLDALAVTGRIVDAGSAELLDLGHGVLLLG
jgi:hypothetical protein